MNFSRNERWVLIESPPSARFIPRFKVAKVNELGFTPSAAFLFENFSVGVWCGGDAMYPPHTLPTFLALQQLLSHLLEVILLLERSSPTPLALDGRNGWTDGMQIIHFPDIHDYYY